MTIIFTELDFQTIDELKAIGDWPAAHNSVTGLLPYIKRLGESIVGVEIGTERGESAYMMLDKCSNIKTLYTVDPFVEYNCWNGRVEQKHIDRFKEIAHKNLATFEDRVKIVEKTSKEAANDFEDASLSFVFLDGSDSFDQQLEDMNLYYKKLKDGGLFSGHNFQLETVRNAQKKFREDNKIRIPIQRTENFSWFWKKV